MSTLLKPRRQETALSDGAGTWSARFLITTFVPGRKNGRITVRFANKPKTWSTEVTLTKAEAAALAAELTAFCLTPEA